jgi:hypothetical protein
MLLKWLFGDQSGCFGIKITPWRRSSHAKKGRFLAAWIKK